MTVMLGDPGRRLGTLGTGSGTSGMEATAFRWVDRAGNITAEENALAVSLRVGDRDGGQQRLGIRMKGVAV